jgi:serine/threonine protein kinase
MAPETISNNEFNIQSDIWSFGITLWEVMTNCLTLPYALINDEQVYQRLKLMGNYLIKSSGSLQLSKPECLNKEFVDLMLECWRPYGERPTFNEIFTFFNKRLNGINIV